MNNLIAKIYDFKVESFYNSGLQLFFADIEFTICEKELLGFFENCFFETCKDFAVNHKWVIQISKGKVFLNLRLFDRDLITLQAEILKKYKTVTEKFNLNLPSVLKLNSFLDKGDREVPA